MLEKYYEPWKQLLAKGVGVNCGECGCFNKPSHRFFLAWLSDVWIFYQKAMHAYKESPVQHLKLVNCHINGVKTPVKID